MLLREAQGRRETEERSDLIVYRETHQAKERADAINSELDSDLSPSNDIDPSVLERMSKYKRT